MGRRVIPVLGGLIAVAITVALLASASTPAHSTPASGCASAHPGGNTPGFNTLLPAGNASGGEYVENVPTARGRCPSEAFTSATLAGVIPPSTERTLLNAGRVGIATEALARATGPGGSTLNVPGLPGAVSNRKAGAATSSTNSGGASSPLVAVADALGGSSGGAGLGTLLPVVLVLCVIGIGGAVLLRRHRVD